MHFTDGICLAEGFKNISGLVQQDCNEDSIITEKNVYQEGNQKILQVINVMLNELVLEGSRLDGIENISHFLAQIKQGKRGLILMEHYSNFDLPGFYYILERSNNPDAKEVAQRLVAVAGMKLNEENPVVKAYASAYSRIIIYPSRSLASISDPVEHERENERSKKINLASMRAMDHARKEGKIILVFPSGTRFRKDKPDTKRGVREIDSYLRLSDLMLLVSINGNCLRISEKDPANMAADEIWHDVIIYTASKVYDCKQFRSEVLSETDDSVEDKKQPVVDRIMQLLEHQHQQAELHRKN